MDFHMTGETLKKIEWALLSVVDQYADEDYAEGDSYSVRLCRDALAAIESDPSKHVGLEDHVEGGRRRTVCAGCGGIWEETDKVDQFGKDYKGYTVIETGDGSCH